MFTLPVFGGVGVAGGVTCRAALPLGVQLHGYGSVGGGVTEVVGVGTIVVGVVLPPAAGVDESFVVATSTEATIPATISTPMTETIRLFRRCRADCWVRRCCCRFSRRRWASRRCRSVGIR
jgi:hypothetical protein